MEETSVDDSNSEEKEENPTPRCDNITRDCNQSDGGAPHSSVKTAESREQQKETPEAPHSSVKTAESREQQKETPEGGDEGHTEVNDNEEEDLHVAMDTFELLPEDQNSTRVSNESLKTTITEAAVTPEQAKTQLKSLLENLGLQHHFQEKLTLNKILKIEKKTITDEATKCNSDLPWYFLKKLMMVNVGARNVKLTSECDSACEDVSDEDRFKFADLVGGLQSGDRVNPLDIITALFLCSDGFVQQELALKMSMCQFSVPLLLPNCDTKQCTLMLWAMRDIVKKYRPSSLSESKGFIEDRIVLSELPMVSFVRLGECSLSKSEILNKLLSNSQHHDTFVHHELQNGDCPRQISNGLTEISWYLPCGNKNMDVFSEPVAVANLRGDIASFETQFAFLCQTSAAVFVFFDSLDSECKLLTNKQHKTQIYLIGNHQSPRFSEDALMKVAKELNLKKNNILLKSKQMNDADFINSLRKAVNSAVENSCVKMKIEQMAGIAHELGVWVDEDSQMCQTAKENADAITAQIQDILEYKEEQLPLQDQIWKDLTCLEKEMFRLRKAPSENIESYKSDLQKEQKDLREQQNSYDISNTMTCFINAISRPGDERCYFLKWMRMNLDNLSREKLSGLREAYKNKNKSPENKEEIKKIDQQLSNSSLGTEHFFREMGQIYEASVSLPKTHPSRRQLAHLPKLCAGLLLDGFPLELVDGDASNIPLTWVTDVLSQLNDMVPPQSKILVVTVLGVQGTGKSTLLNTMFGVQFAVSSGRCTRGAFMLLIKVDEDVKDRLNCDYLVIIDTEGLKSSELSKLDNSYEHDNELATLVVGLSDITIINIAMENSTEMKDILQIVVHAFFRMTSVGKKPKCQFVHQNVADVSAPEKNLRERELLLEQLNEMTQAAAKMENKDFKSFTEVMEYNPDTGNCYVPGLWNGSPPMAPVNTGYSEVVYELKKNILKSLGESSASNLLEFIEWTTSLWKAVKHENFIFSFRNSLVADAYMRLCTEFNKWEWEFKKEMYSWTQTAETKISNSGRVKPETSCMEDLLTELKDKACSEVSAWEKKLLENLEKYFKQTEGHVHLVEAYREDFANSAKSLCREMQRSVYNQLTTATDIRRGMRELDRIKVNHTKELEERVRVLIEDCRKKKENMTEQKLDQEFDKMWDKMLMEQDLFKQKPKDVTESVSSILRKNLSHKGGAACELLSQKQLRDCGSGHFKYTVEGRLKQFKNTVNKLFYSEDHAKTLQSIADGIIIECQQSVKEKVTRKNDYHDTFILEILHMIDERLNKHKNEKIEIEFEVSLKQHICGFAAREFQKMHEDFIQRNDPSRCLNKNKERFRTIFKDEFNNRDQCQKRAEEFTDHCLGPAVLDFIYKSMGSDITGEMGTWFQFSTQMSFQYSVLLDLITKDSFYYYLSYICSYEWYIKEWIHDEMLKLLTKETLSGFEDRHLRSSIKSINDAVLKAQEKKGANLQELIEDIRQELGTKLVISEDALGPFKILTNVKPEEFAQCLTVCVEDMEEKLRKELKDTRTDNKLEHLHINAERDLFNRVIGCGKLCPFCRAPCEAGGSDHRVHQTSLHRPQGLGNYSSVQSDILLIDICTSWVNSRCKFLCNETQKKWHKYKEYRQIFPLWKIPPDKNLKASDYWKYVLTRFNKEFAEAYKKNPAEIPDSWKNITPADAIKSLKSSFNVN